MNKLIFTIGYSGYKPDEFISELLRRKINVLIDVRSVLLKSLTGEKVFNNLAKNA
jgi:hypothetical protein